MSREPFDDKDVEKDLLFTYLNEDQGILPRAVQTLSWYMLRLIYLLYILRY